LKPKTELKVVGSLLNNCDMLGAQNVPYLIDVKLVRFGQTQMRKLRTSEARQLRDFLQGLKPSHFIGLIGTTEVMP
jgi:hypothetical protein